MMVAMYACVDRWWSTRSSLFLCSVASMDLCFPPARSHPQQNYFDKFGIFTSLLISAPLIVMSFGILIYAITRASSLLIEVKRLELTKNRSSTQKNKKEGTTTSQADTNEKKDNTTTTTTTTRVETTTNQGGSTTASEGNSTRKRK